MEKYYPEILQQYLDNERIENAGNTDKAAKTAADICGRCQSASDASKESEPVNRKERAKFGELIKPQWAKNNGLWIPEDHFNSQYANRKIGQGAE